MFLRIAQGLFFVSVFVALSVGTVQASPPKVVTTIAPLHSIASNVMQNVGSPKLLMKAGASPHSYAMKPSEAKMISEAELIVWVGPSLENFLPKAMETLGKNAKTIELLKEDDLLLLDQRAGDEHGGELDPHLWLTSRNGGEIAQIIAQALIEIDPSNGETYLKNARAFREKMDKVRRRLEVQLRSYGTVPFMTFHDGFQYFERDFSLASKGYVTAHPERPIGAKRATLLRATMTSQNIQCLFLEPQFQPKLAKALTEGTQVRTGTLDPLGTDIPLGVDFFPTLIETIGQSFISCLSGKS